MTLTTCVFKKKIDTNVSIKKLTQARVSTKSWHECLPVQNTYVFSLLILIIRCILSLSRFALLALSLAICKVWSLCPHYRFVYVVVAMNMIVLATNNDMSWTRSAQECTVTLPLQRFSKFGSKKGCNMYVHTNSNIGKIPVAAFYFNTMRQFCKRARLDNTVQQTFVATFCWQ